MGRGRAGQTGTLGQRRTLGGVLGAAAGRGDLNARSRRQLGNLALGGRVGLGRNAAAAARRSGVAPRARAGRAVPGFQAAQRDARRAAPRPRRRR